jgi:cob(I)alamin adenosyltransferase
MKLYTRTGDDGATGLFGGGRVPKDDPRMHAIGEVDELNACIGLAITALPAAVPKPGQASPQRPQARAAPQSIANSFLAILTALQSRLFDLGADLATPLDSAHESKIQRIAAEHVAEAEGWIDQIDSGNTPLKQFVLPGGTELSARLHHARTVCRRAERALVSLGRAVPINPQTIILLNRVSDLLFALARRANKEANVPDVPWVPQK